MSRSRRANITLEGAAAAPATSAAAGSAVSPRHEAGSFVQAAAKLEQDYRELKKKNRKLQNENTELKGEMEELRMQNIELQEVVKKLETEKTHLEEVKPKSELEKRKWNEVQRKVMDLFSDLSEYTGGNSILSEPSSTTGALDGPVGANNTGQEQDDDANSENEEGDHDRSSSSDSQASVIGRDLRMPVELNPTVPLTRLSTGPPILAGQLPPHIRKAVREGKCRDPRLNNMP